MTIVARLVRNTIPQSLRSLPSQTLSRSVSSAEEGWAQITYSVLHSRGELPGSSWNLWAASRESWAIMKSLRCSRKSLANKTYSEPLAYPLKGNRVSRMTQQLLETKNKLVDPASNVILPHRPRFTSKLAYLSTICAQVLTSLTRKSFREREAFLSIESSDFLVGSLSRMLILEMELIYRTSTSSQGLKSVGEILLARATKWSLGWISYLSHRTRRSNR